jgi:ABC-type phosphate transport system substrate-binding protein
MGSPLQPAMNGIPGDSFHPSNGGLVQALYAERGDLIEGRTTMLESVVWRTGVRAERPAAITATISTTPPQIGFVESVADNI